ncbi:DUF3888 domain-containing protein [Desulfosporosinus fructosivorans]|uniref:DUF3888 domain-containing protein n=2 Tax=Desulfosporosinus fructosivorans TaxID=2018669 RepID=A0A4Z0R460_9FIRM|nr:DUF3888 domain-containing protein [Desulfosporosinus fructosivorans]
MKKMISLLLFSCLLVATLMGCSKTAGLESAKLPVAIASTSSTETASKAPKQSQQELYQDVFVTLLDPYIQKELDDYYGRLLSISPMYSPEYVEILNVERPMGYRSFSFIIKLQVEPYVGPHESIGIDRLTIRVGSGEGEVKVEKHEHIKSYEKNRNFSYDDELTFYKNDEKISKNPTAISVVTKYLEATI